MTTRENLITVLDGGTSARRRNLWHGASRGGLGRRLEARRSLNAPVADGTTFNHTLEKQT